MTARDSEAKRTWTGFIENLLAMRSIIEPSQPYLRILPPDPPVILVTCTCSLGGPG